MGKTTCSCSVAVQLAAVRRSVLLVSTDPAHNLSDAFGQKMGGEPTLVNGFDNLHAMEVTPKVEFGEMDGVAPGSPEAMILELASSIPGIDEAVSFAELMKSVQNYDHDCIVFDTAPTGHTLRLLSFPQVLDKGLGKLMQFKDTFGPMVSNMMGFLGRGQGGGGAAEAQGAAGGAAGPGDAAAMAAAGQAEVVSKLEETKKVIEAVIEVFKDPEKATFVCVMIPEFLSLYETERLIQELARYEIDAHNIIVNQCLCPPEGVPGPGEEGGEAAAGEEQHWAVQLCFARMAMQRKYLQQVQELYEDFNVTFVALQAKEVRGVDAIRTFSQNLVTPVAASRLIGDGAGAD